MLTLKINRLLGLIFLCTFFVFSCNKDVCKDVECGFGLCTDGTCVCQSGYEGSNCQTEWRSNNIGNYSGSVVSATVTQPLALKVTEGLNSVLHINLGEIKAEMSNKDEFHVPLQEWTYSGKKYFVEGDGVFEGNILKFNMNMNDGNKVKVFSYVGSKS